jgi:hypothetical protein
VESLSSRQVTCFKNWEFCFHYWTKGRCMKLETKLFTLGQTPSYTDCRDYKCNLWQISGFHSSENRILRSSKWLPTFQTNLLHLLSWSRFLKNIGNQLQNCMLSPRRPQCKYTLCKLFQYVTNYIITFLRSPWNTAATCSAVWWQISGHQVTLKGTLQQFPLVPDSLLSLQDKKNVYNYTVTCPRFCDEQ